MIQFNDGSVHNSTLLFSTARKESLPSEKILYSLNEKENKSLKVLESLK